LAENLAKEIIQKYPDHPFGWKVLGAVFRQTRRLQESLIAKQRTVALSPDDVYAHSNLGATLQELGRLGEAETSYKKAISIKPEYEEAYFNLGNAQRELGRLEEAETSYKKAISIKPDLAEAHGNLGVTLKELGRLEEAEASYKKAISIKPEYVEAHSNLGVALQLLGKLQEAETSYKKALAINPEFAQAHTNWGVILYERGLWTEAIELHRKAVALNPASVIFQWYFTLMQIQKVYSIRGDIEKSIYCFGLELTKLDNLITAERLDEAIKAVGIVQPYYIAYLENNNKYLLTKYGEICCRVMSYWQDKHLGLLSNESKELNIRRKIKVGIISSHIRYHSVWNAFLKGIVTQINKKDFDLYIYYLSDQTDDETLVARKNSTKFVIGRKSLYEWYKIIINDDLDIALFPEIGMHRLTLQLASMKLAKSQCTSWGHPETSGLPSIDYYISSDFMETANSSDNYSETMISLDNIGCYFEPPSLEKEEINLFEFGINLNSNILLCLGAPNKFHPDNDILYIEIIKKISNCQLVFMRDESDAYKIVEQRLNLKFEKNNLPFKNKVVFIPPLSRAGFNTLMNLSRVLLDNIYFSGFNTSIQALGCGLPIVTLKGKFMRSRAASGMLKRIHLDELIANSQEMYIKIVQRLVNDSVYYQSVKTTIKNNVHFLYKDIAPIRTLENFFIKITLKDC
jgi:predicted O-linked N-acetylglucosamine transferase (SPINDLY family)